MKIAWLALVVMLAAAGSAEARAKKKAKPAPEPSGNMSSKLRPYMDFVETHSGAILGGRKKYLASVDPKKGPRCDKAPVIPAPVRPSPDDLNALRAGKNTRPTVKDLEEAGVEIADSITDLDELLAEAAEYYRGDFKKDKCAKGRTLHMRMTTDWDMYAEAYATIHGYVDAEVEKKEDASLAKVEGKYGLGYRYHHAKAMIQATRLMRAVEAQSLEEKPHGAEVKKAFEDLRATVMEISELDKAKHEIALKAGYSDFAKSAVDFTAFADKAQQKLSDGKSLDVKESDKLDDLHKELERTHDAVTFTKKLK